MEQSQKEQMLQQQLAEAQNKIADAEQQKAQAQMQSASARAQIDFLKTKLDETELMLDSAEKGEKLRIEKHKINVDTALKLTELEVKNKADQDKNFKQNQETVSE